MKSLRTLTAAGAFLALAGLSGLEAAPSATQSPIPAANSQTPNLLQLVHYPYAHCRWWRRECSVRWGWGTWRFHRCMYLHGC